MQVESKIIQGLMRLSDLSVDDLYKLIRFDLDNGVKYFDISDIYLDGEAEKKCLFKLNVEYAKIEKMILFFMT